MVLALALARQFRYIPYGESAPAGVPSLSCDGKVPGTTLDLTHWTNNETPEALYADTSTEIALNFAHARLRGDYADLDDALIVNNHFDSDGVLSVFACTHPEEALRHAPLMVAGAEAGDFGEWSTDAGVQLDCALNALCTDDDDEGYGGALDVLPGLLEDLDSHADLWRDGWDATVSSYELLARGEAEISRHGRVAVLTQPASRARVDAAALHRGLRDRGVDGLAGPADACLRVLRAEHDGARWRYEYSKPGHGWVARLKERAEVPAADGAAIAAGLNERLGAGWEAAGGLIPICRTRWVDAPPDAVIAALAEVDAAAN